MKRYGLFLVVIGAMLWGTDSLFRRPLTGSFSPVTLVFLEHCVLITVTLPLLLKARAQVRAMTRKDWAALSVIALGGSVAATSLFTYAIKYGNPSVTVLLQKTEPLLTLLLARVFLGERPRPWFWRWLGPAMIEPVVERRCGGQLTAQIGKHRSRMGLYGKLLGCS